jgi:L-lactate dehydrogenase complex protein LldG
VSETSLSAKEQMLGRIRAALGRGASQPAPGALPSYSSGSPCADAGDGVGLFREKVVRAGGLIQAVRSAAEVAEYLRGLLPPLAPTKVAVSDGAERAAGGLRELLKAAGAAVIPSFHECAADFSPEQYARELLEASAGVTSAQHALAETGTLVLHSGDEQHRLISLLPPVHVCILSPQAILANLESLCADRAEAMPRVLTLVTGPSRTADIEQTLTVGMHGPGELHVLLYTPGA